MGNEDMLADVIRIATGHGARVRSLVRSAIGEIANRVALPEHPRVPPAAAASPDDAS